MKIIDCLIVTALVEYYPTAGTEIILEVKGEKEKGREIFYPDISDMDRFHIDYICSYALGECVTDLEGEFLRAVIHESKVIGYGHRTKDRFFLLNEDETAGEYTEEELRKRFK